MRVACNSKMTRTSWSLVDRVATHAGLLPLGLPNSKKFFLKKKNIMDRCEEFATPFIVISPGLEKARTRTQNGLE